MENKQYPENVIIGDEKIKEYPDNVYYVGAEPGEYDPFHDLDIRALDKYAKEHGLRGKEPIPLEITMMFQRPRKNKTSK